MWLPTVHRPICNQDAYNQYNPTKNQAASNLSISSPITKASWVVWLFCARLFALQNLQDTARSINNRPPHEV